MKKKISIIFIFSILSSFLVGCNKKTEHPIQEYIVEYDIGKKEDFNILQLTDIHVADKDDRERQYNYLKKVIGTSNADMIIVTGDMFTFSSKKTAKELFGLFDSFNIPWAVTFGNHDEQCYFSMDWLTDYLNNYGSNCLFKNVKNDNVDGYANYAINLMKNGTLFNQIILFDSNRYNYGEYVGYDYIKENQIEWYKKLVTYTKSIYGEYDSQAFFHIPVPEYDDAYNALENGEAELIMGVKNEKSCPPLKNTGLFSVMKELNSTRSINVGHDHLNNFVISYQGIYLAYGVDSSDRIYFTEELLGGRIITIHSDKTLSFSDHLVSYEE